MSKYKVKWKEARVTKKFTINTSECKKRFPNIEDLVIPASLKQPIPDHLKIVESKTTYGIPEPKEDHKDVY